MSKAVCRIGDTTNGHSPGFPPTTCLSGSSTIFINNIGVTRVGDSFASHALPYPPVLSHDSVSAQGSSTIFFENLAVSRVGDLTSCSDTIAVGSPDVFFG